MKTFPTDATRTEVNMAIDRAFEGCAAAPMISDYKDSDFTLVGFNNQFAGINYRATAVFEHEEKRDRLTITANIDHRPTLWFWFFLVVGLVGYVVPGLGVVAFFYFSRTLVTNQIARGLESVGEQLSTSNLATTSTNVKPGPASDSSSAELLTGTSVVRKFRNLHNLKTVEAIDDEEYRVQTDALLNEVRHGRTNDDLANFIGPLAGLVNEGIITADEVKAFKTAYSAMKDGV
jgi:hypothetical protein